MTRAGVASGGRRALGLPAPFARDRLDPALLVALALLGTAVAAVQLRNYVALHDEGLVLQAAARIADGDWPYRDFWWSYGPGQPLLLAALEPLTGGPSLLVWRIVRALTDVGTALLAFVIVRRHSRCRGLCWSGRPACCWSSWRGFHIRTRASAF